MKLTVKEQQAIRDGAREIRRTVRRRRATGKRLNLSVKRGEAFDVGGIYVSVKGIRRDGDQWVIRLEDVGEWAITAQEEKGPRLSLEALEEGLPGALTWHEKPDIEVGDIFVFEWHKIRDPNAGGFDRSGKWHEGGKPINAEVPEVYIKITSVVRGRKGEYMAHYEKHGFDRPHYLAPKLGYTTNPEQALSTAAVLPIREDVAISQRDAQVRERHRLEQLRATHQRQLARAKGPGRIALLTVSLTDVERQIRALDGEGLKRAA